MTSMNEIARIAGVSKSKVSKALNDRYGVSPDEAKRIKEVAKSLGYTENRLVKSISTGHSKLIGCLVHDMANPYYTEIMMGVEEAASRNDYAAIFIDASRGAGPDVYRLLEYRVDGMILAALPVTPQGTSGLKAFNGSGRPIIVSQVDPFRLPRGAGRIVVDYIGAMNAIIAHLVALGHTRIAFCGRNTANPRQSFKLDGFIKAMEHHGLTVRQDYLLAGDGFSDDIPGGFHAANRCLDTDPPPTALVCHNDLMAMALIKGLTQKGIRVPEDVSVFGFDGVECLHPLLQAPTTIHTDNRTRGSRLVEGLITMIKTGKPVVENQEWTLMDNGTTGACRK